MNSTGWWADPSIARLTWHKCDYCFWTLGTFARAIAHSLGFAADHEVARAAVEENLSRFAEWYCEAQGFETCD